MFHVREVPPAPGPVKHGGHRRAVRRGAAVVLVSLAGAALQGCEGTTTVLPTPRFGQLGEIHVEVRSPLDTTGFLTETLVWRAEGPWILVERVTYRGMQGSETVRYSRLNPGDLAVEYASLLRQLNETPGLRLFGGSLSQDLDPVCNPVVEPGSLPTRVVVTIRDDFRGETARWARCARGTFFTITPGEAGPDPEASRVVTAGQLARSFTLGEGHRSTYPGTMPYATLDHGEHSAALPQGPLAFASTNGEAPRAFLDFWAAHAGDALLPLVDWGAEVVLLAAVGERGEAGDEVKVKRVVPIGSSTRVEFVERIPGDFCSPAAKRIHPFHLVVVPAVPLPIEFTSPEVERIPCGV